MTSHATTGDGFIWTAWPARERPGRAALGSALILAFSAALWLAFSSPWWAVFSVVVLSASLNRFFGPSRFSLDSTGITARYPLRTRHMKWADVRRFAHDANGGYLSTRVRPSRLDGLRGMHLLFGLDCEPVIARIASRIAAARLHKPASEPTAAGANHAAAPVEGATA